DMTTPGIGGEVWSLITQRKWRRFVDGRKRRRVVFHLAACLPAVRQEPPATLRLNETHLNPTYTSAACSASLCRPTRPSSVPRPWPSAADGRRSCGSAARPVPHAPP